MNPEAKRTPELEQLLIDAEADDDGVQHSHPLVSRPWLLLLGLVLVALNLRPALSSLSPLLSEVSSSLDRGVFPGGCQPDLCTGGHRRSGGWDCVELAGGAPACLDD
ncbi:hypothetical protein L9Z73_09345, partial [Pseudomonas sp. TNT11]|nr:hypothetical protein [Pseudomonas emilianonis]